MKKSIEIPDSEMPIGAVAMRHAFDAAWEAVLRTESLKPALAKLSVHDLRGILRAAVPAAVSASGESASAWSTSLRR